MSTEAHARHWVAMLETTEAKRCGLPVPRAREAIARRLGVSPGTLQNIRKGRTKALRFWLVERIRCAVVGEIEKEIRSLEHELQMARLCGAHAGSLEILKAETALADARKALMSK